MNVNRIITVAIGLPIIVAILVMGNKHAIDILIAIIGVVGIYEYSKCSSKETKIVSWVAYLCAISISLVHIVSKEILSFATTLGIPILLIILFLHVIISNMKITFKDIAYTFFGICYVCGFLIFIPLIYGIEGEISGKVLIWFVMLSAWATDTFAYIIGKNFGKHYFSKVSPNKTIEGCIAGTVLSIITVLIYTFFINTHMNYNISYINIASIGLILSIAGQVGDFSASVIKRFFGVKDFSNLFPGHGGMIDRIDSVMFIAPFAYFLLSNFI